MGGLVVRRGWWLIAAAVAACTGPPGAADPDAAIDGPPVIDAAADPPDASAPAPDAAPPDATVPDAGAPDASPIVCPPIDQCHGPGIFDPVTGRCSEPPVPDDTPCDDGSICTDADACQAGACTGGIDIAPPGDLCDDGVCFTDIAPSGGIEFSSTAFMTSFMSAAGVLLDYDGDGALDVLLASESATPTLYRNLGDGTFEDVTSAAGIPVVLSSERLMGLSAADYDNDGDPDVYVTFRGPNRLWRNDGGVFTDVTAEAGVGDDRWSMSATFGDYDRDGFLDLYVGNYIDEKMFPFHDPQPNALYRNLGDGTFEDVTAALDVGGLGTTLAVAWTDYDADGQLDLIVCNDFGEFIEPNKLYDYDGATFTESSETLGTDIAFFCMGIAPGDYDRDGDMDYYFTNLGKNALLRNDGAAFADATDATGTAQHFDRCFTELFITSWSTGFGDFDNDGWLDLYVSNGHVPAARIIDNSRQTANALFHHDGAALTFTEISHTAGVDDGRIGRAAAFGDIDRDGDLDILQVNADGQAALYRNDSTVLGGSIVVDLHGRTSNRDGLGARLAVTTPEATLIREATRTYGYLMASDPAVHVGIGAAPTADVDIAWPSGIAQHLVAVPASTRVAAVEPAVTIASATPDMTAVSETAVIDVSVELINHTAAPVDVTVSATLNGTTSGPVAITVPAADVATTVVSVTAMGSGSVPLVTSVTESGSLDQRSTTIDIAP